jgi:hypothetical protein
LATAARGDRLNWVAIVGRLLGKQPPRKTAVVYLDKWYTACRSFQHQFF